MDSSSPEIKNSSDWEQFSGQLIKVFFSSENAFGVTGALTVNIWVWKWMCHYTGLVELWSMYVVWERESMKNRTLQGEALLASQNGPFLLS